MRCLITCSSRVVNLRRGSPPGPVAQARPAAKGTEEAAHRALTLSDDMANSIVRVAQIVQSNYLGTEIGCVPHAAGVGCHAGCCVWRCLQGDCAVAVCGAERSSACAAFGGVGASLTSLSATRVCSSKRQPSRCHETRGRTTSKLSLATSPDVEHPRTLHRTYLVF